MPDSRTPRDGQPYYCTVCGIGFAEAIACEDPQCELESIEMAKSRAVPKRIQRRRTKGWQMPPGAIAVGRPSRWGNRYRIARPKDDGRWWILDDLDWYVDDEVIDGPFASRREAAENAVRRCREEVDANGGLQLMIIDALRGHDLACWCKLCPEHAAGKPLGVHCEECDPCHADVLLGIVNA